MGGGDPLPLYLWLLVFSHRLPRAKAVKRRIYVWALLLSNVALQFCFIMILKSQYVCSVLSQKNKNTTRAGVKENVGLRGILLQCLESPKLPFVISDGA